MGTQGCGPGVAQAVTAPRPPSETNPSLEATAFLNSARSNKVRLWQPRGQDSDISEIYWFSRETRREKQRDRDRDREDRLRDSNSEKKAERNRERERQRESKSE